MNTNIDIKSKKNIIIIFYILFALCLFYYLIYLDSFKLQESFGCLPKRDSETFLKNTMHPTIPNVVISESCEECNNGKRLKSQFRNEDVEICKSSNINDCCENNPNIPEYILDRWPP